MTFLIIYICLGVFALLVRIHTKKKRLKCINIAKYAAQTFVPFLISIGLLVLWRQPWSSGTYDVGSDSLLIIVVICFYILLFIPYLFMKRGDDS